MENPLHEKLELARRDLLDLTARNRLLNTPFGRGRTTRLDIVEERSSDIIRILAQERREMTFLPSGNPAEETLPSASTVPSQVGDAATDVESEDLGDLSQPEEEEEDAGRRNRYTDRHLQTQLSSEQLQLKLLRLSVEARTIQEEQGINALFIALGFLEWYEDRNSDKPRFAPLVLVPIELHRKSANARFRIKALEDDLSTNLSLQARLQTDFLINLPSLPDSEELDVGAYFDAVEKVIIDQPRWQVHRNRMTVWFFSFAKFLMFRDLLPDAWSELHRLEDQPLVKAMLGEGFRDDGPAMSDSENLDSTLVPRNLMHVVDADSSQAASIEEIRLGRNLVIQGPPGTGKSQTITNIIAAAVKDGKKVLFVAEKMAALQVVKARLDRVGLGDMCLELHSHKANKKSVFAELEQTLSIGRPRSVDFDTQASELERSRDRLNQYVNELHAPIEPFGVTPYSLIGQLCRLKAANTQPLSVTLPQVGSWSLSTFNEKQQILREISLNLVELGPPQEHPFWGTSRVQPLLPSDVSSLAESLRKLDETLTELNGLARSLAAQLRISWADDTATPHTVQRMISVAESLLTMPPLDPSCLMNEAWTRQLDEVKRAVAAVAGWNECQRETESRVSLVAWQTDLSEARRQLAANGRSWFRWFSGSWRQARRSLQGILTGPLPSGLDDQLQLMDFVIKGQKCGKALQNSSSLFRIGENAFGARWKGLDSDANELTAILNWNERCQKISLPNSFRKIAAGWRPSESVRKILADLKEKFESTTSRFAALSETLGVSVDLVFGKSRFEQIPLKELAARLRIWQQSLEEVNRWVVFRRRLRALDEAGLNSLIPVIESGADPHTLVDRFELMFCEAAMRKALSEREQLAGFNRVSHEELQRSFQRLDEERIRLARREVAASHFDGIPTGGDAGEIGIIRGETRKKRNIRSVRRLMTDAGRAVQALKPVFMMSPISVAQFLEPASVSFDLLVIDEASQVRPVEALGAIARCRQLVVVGDNRQLPPTQFFDKAIADDGSTNDEDATAVGDVESVLDLCQARNMPNRMLRWHYRSRHHSLIAVSNREFYGSNLFVVPSPEQVSADRGLSFRFVPDGIFDRGASRTNKIEARTVAHAMIQHAVSAPHLSLGVGAFSVAQRDAVLDELELLRRTHPEAEDFFAEGRDEPWFIKNLENIQGDERDVILISVGYGKDKSGYFAMGFGPLSAQGGERRLNVLITRARERCEVFSSIRAEDIDLRRTTAVGTTALKTFLEYAETGKLDTGRATGRDFDSEFEAQVAEQLRKLGYEVDCQVGVAGFFIDLAILDPDCPGRYLMGIECDGATYHSSRWARDRDRLREQVLVDHGWTLHRIWSTDWFQSQESQLRRLVAAVVDAKSGHSATNTSSAS